MFGTPTANGQSALMNFGLRNTLEMKARSPRDTSDTYKKISLLETFDFQTSYNIITKQWANISFNTGTRLLNNKIDIRLNAVIDPYSLDSAGRQTNILEIRKDRRIGRITGAQLMLSTNFSSKQGGKSKSNQPQPSTNPPIEIPNPEDAESQKNPLMDNSGQSVDFSIPWSMNMSYSLSYSKPAFKSTLIQSVRLSGDLSLTKKWKIGLNSGYDFVTHKITTTDISIYRDLHCWEMRISCVPFGAYQSYNFYINVKSSILKDLKYTKHKSWYDNF